MPPKGRPRRGTARKPNPKSQTDIVSPPPNKPIDNDVVSPQTLTPPDKPVDYVVSPQTITSPDKPVNDVVSSDNLTAPDEPVNDVVSSENQPPRDKPVDDVVSSGNLLPSDKSIDDVVSSGNLASSDKPVNDVVSSETLIPRDKPVDDAVSSETLAMQEHPTSVAVNGGEMRVIGKCATTVEDNGGNNVGKPKKVVKKTIKVLKKVMKKVPKKVVKQGIGIESKSGGVTEECGGGSVELESKAKVETETAAVDKEELKCGGSVSGQSKVESRGSGGLVDDAVEIGEKNGGLEENKVEVEETNGGLEENKVEVEVEGGGLEENMVEVDEKIGGLEENKVEVDEMNEEFEDGDAVRSKNEGDVEERSVGEGEKKEKKNREWGKECEELGEGGNKEEREGEEEVVGEVKLLSGELGAMERKKRRKREVFIGKLDKDVTEEDVRKVFQEAGEIVDLRVLMNSKTGKKFAFVMYAAAEHAQRALEKFAKVEICGKECGATPVEGNDTIFLGSIDKKWTEEDVIQLLKKIGIGKIDKVTVMVDPNNTKCNRGFAFVEFETIKDAQAAYTKLQEKDVFGKNQKLKVAWAEPLKELDEEEMLKVKTVYAEFIPSSWDEEKVRDAFTKFGEIDDIVLARNLRTSKRKDFAFISYKTRVAAINCIESFDLDLGEENGTKVNVKVSLAKPKSKSKKPPHAKPFASETPKARPATSHSNVRSRESRNRTQPSLPHYGIQIPETTSTNVELVHLLREQASWRTTHASLSNGPMDIHHPNPVSGRKRQFPVLETDRLHEDMNIYRRPRLDAYSVPSSSLVHPSALMNPEAYHPRHVDYPSGPVYGARNYASNVELRDRGHERSFPYRRYPG